MYSKKVNHITRLLLIGVVGFLIVEYGVSGESSIEVVGDLSTLNRSSEDEFLTFDLTDMDDEGTVYSGTLAEADVVSGDLVETIEDELGYDMDEIFAGVTEEISQVIALFDGADEVSDVSEMIQESVNAAEAVQVDIREAFEDVTFDFSDDGSVTISSGESFESEMSEIDETLIELLEGMSGVSIEVGDDGHSVTIVNEK